MYIHQHHSSDTCLARKVWETWRRCPTILWCPEDQCDPTPLVSAVKQKEFIHSCYEATQTRVVQIRVTTSIVVLRRLSQFNKSCVWRNVDVLFQLKMGSRWFSVQAVLLFYRTKAIVNRSLLYAISQLYHDIFWLKLQHRYNRWNSVLRFDFGGQKWWSL